VRKLAMNNFFTFTWAKLSSNFTGSCRRHCHNCHCTRTHFSAFLDVTILGECARGADPRSHLPANNPYWVCMWCEDIEAVIMFSLWDLSFFAGG
jgi:hypothetical protein